MPRLPVQGWSLLPGLTAGPQSAAQPHLLPSVFSAGPRGPCPEKGLSNGHSRRGRWGRSTSPHWDIPPSSSTSAAALSKGSRCPLWACNCLLEAPKATGVRSETGRTISGRKGPCGGWVSSLVVDPTDSLPIFLTGARVPLITIISLSSISTKCPQYNSA